MTTSYLPDHAYVNAFNLIPGVGAKKLTLLANHFDDFSHAWHASSNELTAAHISPKLAHDIITRRNHIDVHAQWTMLHDQHISMITESDVHFPPSLRQIDHAPFCLYVRGDLSVLCTPAVAVVGSRKISDYGARATTYLSGEIAQHDITIISGLALGTDALAHRAALEHAGRTIAIVAGGVDDHTIAPRSHLSLAHKIIDMGGAIISEYPIGTSPSRGTFPARNRLMAGIADATIIIEAAKDSGTLITARHAIEFHKKLFALPGSIFSKTAYGPNELIRHDKATPLFTSTDVISLFHKTHDINDPVTKRSFSDHLQQTVYDLIAEADDGIQINMLIKKSDFNATSISTTLTLLEIAGHVKNIGNQTYIVL